jgi:hypothetical protein
LHKSTPNGAKGQRIEQKLTQKSSSGSLFDIFGGAVIAAALWRAEGYKVNANSGEQK